MSTFVHFAGLMKPNSKTIYDEIDRKLSFCFRILDFAVKNVMPVGMTFPLLALSYFVYFSTNAGSDAFQLPFYARWVSFKIQKTERQLIHRFMYPSQTKGCRLIGKILLDIFLRIFLNLWFSWLLFWLLCVWQLSPLWYTYYSFHFPKTSNWI